MGFDTAVSFFFFTFIVWFLPMQNIKLMFILKHLMQTQIPVLHLSSLSCTFWSDVSKVKLQL